VYNGAAGVALFLAMLHGFTGDDEARATAVAAVRGALAGAGDVQPSIRLSFYSGWVGIGFAALACGELLGERSIATEGRRLLRRAGNLEPDGRPTDQFIGVASAIAPLLALHRHSGSEWPLAAAQRIGESLLGSSRQRDVGRSWEPSGPFAHLHRDALTGFGHGVSGIAWSLLVLGEALDSDEFRRAAEEGFEYEQTWYRADQGNWLDLRYMAGPDGDVNDGRTCQIQWCHGAAGIGLARLDAYRLLGADDYREEAAEAAGAVRRDLARWPDNWQPGFSLCHGVAGNCDLLVECGRVLDDDELRHAARDGADLGIDNFASTGKPWPGALGAVEIPSLFTGVAGSAWFLLRVHDPDVVPSLLLPNALELLLSPARV
jgi:lantibiotic biosynthesis protein